MGVDVGTTTTTQVAVSRLRVSAPTYDGAAAPEIRDRTVVHRGDVRATPLVDSETVDVDAVADAIDRLDGTVVVVTEQNCANALGQLLATRTDEPFLALDELHLSADVRLDVGAPLSGRDAVPVVVKTLAFGG